MISAIKNIASTCLLASLLLYSELLFCQKISEDTQVLFHNISTQNGLGHSRVNALLQDSCGYIWIGTEDGLCRYDGYEIIVFRHNANDSLTISSNVITSLATDTKGNLWIGTTRGLNVYHRGEERFVRFMHNPTVPNSIRHNHILKVISKKDGLVIIETLGGSLTIFDEKGLKTKHYAHYQASQPYYRYHGLLEDKDENIWFGGRNLAIHKFNTKNSTFEMFWANAQQKNRKRDDDVSFIYNHSKWGWFTAGLDGFYSFTPETGDFRKLFGTTTYCITADKNETLWIGTGNGLAKYLPSEETIMFFRSNPNSPNSLANNRVNAVLCDKEGNIWAGTNDGVSILNLKSNKFTVLSRTTENSQSLSSNTISALHEDSRGKLWIGTKDKGINVWDETKNVFDKKSKDNGELLANEVSCIYEDSNSEVWIGLWAGLGLNRINLKNGQIAHFAIDPKSRKVDWYNDFYEDPFGNLWVGVWGNQGLQAFDKKKNKLADEVYITYQIPYRHEINDLVKAGDYLLISATTGNYYLYHIPTKSFKPFSNHFKIKGEILSIKQFAKLNDDELLFTSNKGLHKLSITKNTVKSVSIEEVVTLCVSENTGYLFALTNEAIEVLSSNLEKIKRYKIGLPIHPNTLIACDSESGIYIHTPAGLHFFDTETSLLTTIHSNATEHFGFVKSSSFLTVFNNNRIFQLKKGKIVDETFPFGKNETNFRITSATYLPNSNYILAFSNLGAFKLSINSGAAISQPMNTKMLSSEMPSMVKRSLYISDSLVFLVYSTDIYSLNLISGAMTHINNTDGKAMSSHLVSRILGETNGTLWVGTTDAGLNRISSDKKTIKHYKLGYPASPLQGNNITAMHIDSDSTLWIGTENGLSRYSKASDSFRNVECSWANGGVLSIKEDNLGFLWIGTPNGLLRLCRKSETCYRFTETEGLPTNRLTNAAVKRADGTLAFGTTKGVVLFNPHNFTEPEAIPQVQITSVEIMGKTAKLNFAKNDTIWLKYNDNFFSIGFSPFTFQHPAKSAFYYKMEGMQSSWIENYGHKVNFAKLNPGSYRFIVSTNNQQHTSTIENSLTIIVTPPFWQRLWFRFAIVSVILVGTFLVLGSYIQQLKLKQQSAELKQKLLLSQMNPHFIFNSLTAIQNYMFTNNSIEAGNYLSNFSRLMRLILENSRSQEILLKHEIQTIKLYISLQKLRFGNKFDYDILVLPNVETDAILIPPMLLQPFIENSIEHGIMHKNAPGYIGVTISQFEEFIQIEIVDDGVGIEKSQKINQERREHHKSFATSITLERIENIARQGLGRAEVTITNRLQTEGTDGTRVLFRIPYRKVKAENLKSKNNEQ